ncbi:MAG: hypothetical protein WCQ50_12800, partial [Spirochaetota bacterium]
GIIHALEKLDAFEDLVLRGDAPRSETAKSAVTKPGLPETVRKAHRTEADSEAESAGATAFVAFSSGDDDSVAETTADGSGSPLATSLPGEDSDAPVATAEKAVDELDIF